MNERSRRVSDPADSRLPAPPPVSAQTALYLDFDGTLTGFAPRPELVSVAPALPGLLAHLQENLGGALAVISGRRLSEIDALLAPVLLAGAGVHGAELRLRPQEPATLYAVPAADALARELRERVGTDTRLLIENKHAAVALHFRQAPELADECIALMRELAAVHRFELLLGNRVAEARGPGFDKGLALRRLAGQPPFAGRKPVFVGDDRTDEDGFAAAQALGGYGVKVGPGATRARYRCPDVAAVQAWLAQAA